MSESENYHADIIHSYLMQCSHEELVEIFGEEELAKRAAEVTAVIDKVLANYVERGMP